MSDQLPDRLIAFIQRLKDARIPHQLATYREGAISVVIRSPGRYWEVDFLEDGEVDVERFVSNGAIEDESALEELFATFADQEPAASHDATAGK